MFQNYDPDMPPELAAATGIHNISANKTNLGKAEIVHTDVAKGSMGARPQLVFSMFQLAFFMTPLTRSHDQNILSILSF